MKQDKPTKSVPDLPKPTQPVPIWKANQRVSKAFGANKFNPRSFTGMRRGSR